MYIFHLTASTWKIQGSTFINHLRFTPHRCMQVFSFFNWFQLCFKMLFNKYIFQVLMHDDYIEIMTPHSITPIFMGNFLPRFMLNYDRCIWITCFLLRKKWIFSIKSSHIHYKISLFILNSLYLCYLCTVTFFAAEFLKKYFK